MLHCCNKYDSIFDIIFIAHTKVRLLPPGMKRISCSWESDELIGHKLWCLHQFYQATACTLGSLRQQLMQLQQIVASLYFITQGRVLFKLQKLRIFKNFHFSHLHHIAFRASPSEFVIPLTKYAKAVYHTRVSVGLRFRMLFETEESSVRRWVLMLGLWCF